MVWLSRLVRAKVEAVSEEAWFGEADSRLSAVSELIFKELYSEGEKDKFGENYPLHGVVKNEELGCNDSKVRE